MTIPGHREAARLLLSLDPPAWSVRHACAVADVASWLARAIDRNGYPIDIRAVEAAALLHDVDKIPAGHDDGTRHGDGSAAWLQAQGVGELAPLVRDHPVTRLADDDDYARLASAPIEAKVIAYADKRAGQRLESMDTRFGSWRRRYPAGPADPAEPGDPAMPAGPSTARPGDRPPSGQGWSGEVAARVEARARALEREVCEAAGVRPGDVRRHHWAKRSLRAAAR